MQVGQFPASAAPSLIEGYCDDFVSLSAVLAQTLEQVSIRGIKLDRSRASLERLERGMREMASAIEELLARGAVTSDFEVALNRPKKEPAADALAAAMAAPAPPPAPTPTPTLPPRAAAKAPAPPAPVQPPAASAAPARKAPPRAPTPTPTPPPAPAPTPPAAKRPAAPPPAPAEPPAPPAPPPARPVPPAAAAQRPMPRPAAAPRAAASVPDQPAPAAPAANGPTKASPMRTRFESLERDRRNGTLYVQAGHETLAFEFVEGCITQTASDGVVADERLGDLLVELRSCTREQLGTVFQRMGPDELHLLGEVLVREGVVTNRQVVEALEKQVQRRVARACSTKDARFDFAEGELLPDDGRVRVAPSALFRSSDRPRG